MFVGINDNLGDIWDARNTRDMLTRYGRDNLVLYEE